MESTVDVTPWTFVRQTEGILEYKLINGLSVLLFPDLSQSTVTVNITYLVGSRHEGRGEAGMAHLLEHMLFKGTPTHPDPKGALQDKGAFFNATTWFDRTNYYETLPASPENLEFALSFEADRMVNSWIRQTDLDAEMTVVRNEFEMGENEPSGVLLDQIMSSAYRWHSYGKSTIGNRSDIERVPATSLAHFYRHFYQPDNAVLIVAGRFSEEDALALTNTFFGAIPRPARELLNTYTEEPDQDGPREVVLQRSGEVAIAAAAYHIPSASHADYPAIQVISELLAHEPSGLLYKTLVKDGLATEIDCYAFGLYEPGIVTIIGRAARPDDVVELKQKVVSHVEKFHESDFSDDDVQQAKATILKSIKLLSQDGTKLALRLSEAIASGDYRLFFLFRDLVRTVSIDDVRRVAQKYFKESNRTSGVFIPTENPERSSIPPRPNLDELLGSYESTHVIASGEHFDATPENIDKSTVVKNLAPHIKLALMPKQTRGDSVNARLYFHYGSEESLTGKTNQLSLLSSLMMRGTTRLNHAQLERELDKLESTLNLVSSAGNIYASIVSDKAHLPGVLNLLAEILQKPQLDNEEFSLIQAKEVSHLQEGLSDPQYIGFDELARLRSPWPSTSIHYRPKIEEKIALVQNTSAEELRSLYHEFLGASNLHASFTGSFGVEEVTQQIQSLFGTWKSPVDYARISDPFMAIKAQSKSIKIADKQMAIVGIANGFLLQDTSPDYPALRLGHYIFGESMKSRIMRRLREKEGISYGAGSSLHTSQYEQNSSMTMYAMAPSSNAHNAADILREEYHRWINDGVEEIELAEAKISFSATIMNSLSNDRYVTSVLVDNLQSERSFTYYRELLNDIDRLTVAGVNKIVQKYLAHAPLVQVVAGDV